MRLVTFHMHTLGDLLFSLPALKALRARYPHAHLTSVAPATFAEVLNATGLINEAVAKPHDGWQGHARLFGELRKRRFELAVCFSQSRSSIIHALACGARRRLGFAQSAMAWTLTDRVTRQGPPSLKNNLRLVQSLGCEAGSSDYIGMIHPSEGHREQAEALLAKAGIDSEGFAVIASTASSHRSIKEWTTSGFAEVIDWLGRRSLRAVAVGTEPPTELLNSCNGDLVDLSGQTTLLQLAALLQRASLFVGIDSGVMHLAAAMRTPVVGIFGPTDPGHTGPMGENSVTVRRDLPCSPCMDSHCRIQTRECLERLPAEQMIAAIESVLARA